MRSIQGKHASYNVQSTVDDKNGLIVHAEAVNDASDDNQFAKQIEQANEVLEQPCEVACADAGYADTEELEKIDSKGIKVIVPSRRQALHDGEKPFSKSEFIYDSDKIAWSGKAIFIKGLGHGLFEVLVVTDRIARTFKPQGAYLSWRHLLA